MEGRALPEAIENALRALFCEKKIFNMGVNGRGLGRFSFRPKSPHKGRCRYRMVVLYQMVVTHAHYPISRYPMVVAHITHAPLCATVDSGIQSLAKADGSSRKTVYFKKFGHCIQL